ncbi:RT0821/Lpp0805 family surface protein [Paenochrobactrum sp. BZR 588]|uniref:RT0821/Lpp0805 family surface protein n=1 Tax=Paenochrobactrum TaxID=999488 RepID=UPI0035BC8A37
MLKTSFASPIAPKCHRWVALCSLIFVAGCAMGGVSIESAVPDASSITGSVAPSQQPDTDNETLSDRNAIRNVVSALDFSTWGMKPVPWANPDTGSQGVINQVSEVQKTDELCREFETSRQAFNGVSLYRGETCMRKGGDWVLKSFAPV